MRILFVSHPNSPHLAKWMRLSSIHRWTTRLFSPVSKQNHLQGRVPFIRNNLGLEQIFRFDALIDEIERFRPDIVHSFGTFDCGEMLLSARSRRKFRWIASSIGDDVGELAALPNRRELIRKIKSTCDLFDTCEGPLLFDGAARKSIHPSLRNRILLEAGHDELYDRSLVALSAIAQNPECLEGYRLVISNPNIATALAAEKLEKSTYIKVQFLGPVLTTNDLGRFRSAAIVINLSICGGLSSTLLESMRAGAMPIESNTSNASDWISHRKSGFIVDPDDPLDVRSALTLAISNHQLLDNAAKVNQAKLLCLTDQEQMKNRFKLFYEQVAEA